MLRNLLCNNIKHIPAIVLTFFNSRFRYYKKVNEKIKKTVLLSETLPYCRNENKPELFVSLLVLNKKQVQYKETKIVNLGSVNKSFL